MVYFSKEEFGAVFHALCFSLKKEKTTPTEPSLQTQKSICTSYYRTITFCIIALPFQLTAMK